MKGVITGKDCVLHSLTVVRVWGVATWLSCVWATVTKKQITFLGVLYRAASPPLALPSPTVTQAGAGTVVLAQALSRAPRAEPSSAWRRAP